MFKIIILGIALTLSINPSNIVEKQSIKELPTTEYQQFYDESVVSEINTRDLMLGRFSIPDTNINVACFNSRDQKVVDNQDSAAMFGQGDMIVIADHTNQGFSKICDCSVGTKAYFNEGYRLKEYICTASFIGHNTGDALTDKNYTSIMYNSNKGGITCYTCLNNWQNVWIVYFQPVN